MKLTGTDRRTDGQDHVLIQADALTKKEKKGNKYLFMYQCTDQ